MNTIKELNTKQVAKNAYKMIIESEYSIESVAWTLKISERSIYYWRTGTRAPNMNHVYGLSQLFGVSVDSLLK